MTQYQETMCEKDVIWAGTLAHLQDFIKHAYVAKDMLDSKTFKQVRKKSALGPCKYFDLFELTSKQYEIKRLLDKGLTCDEISKLLGIKIETVWTAKRRLRRKLGLPIRKYNKKNK